MNRFNRSLLVAAFAGGLSGGVGLVQAGLISTVHGVQKLGEEHWKYKHMHQAVVHLREARSELERAEEIFKGHRAESIEHVDRAIEQALSGLKEQHDEAVIPAAQSPSKLERFEHMHHALENLRKAREELDAADKIFQGHREKALAHTNAAIKQLEIGIRDAER